MSMEAAPISAHPHPNSCEIGCMKTASEERAIAIPLNMVPANGDAATPNDLSYGWTLGVLQSPPKVQ